MDPFRGLQVEASSSSNCYCPIDVIVAESGVTSTQLKEALQSGFEDANVPLILDDLDEPISVPCAADSTEFTSELIFAFSAFESVTIDDVNALGQVMTDTYNEMGNIYCDPQTRRVFKLDVKEFTPLSTDRRLQSGCLNYEATFLVTGSCRGCEDRALILEDFAETGDLARRALQSSFPRSPQSSVSLLPAPNIPNICGLPVSQVLCDTVPDGNEFFFSQIISLKRQDGGPLTETDLALLDGALHDAYNLAKLSLYNTCDSDYRQLSDVEADRSVIECFRRDMLAEEDEAIESLSTKENPNPQLSRSLKAYSVTFGFKVNCKNTNPCGSENFVDTGDAIIQAFEALDYIVHGFNVIVSESPSAALSEFPSEIPSEFPSKFPTNLPSSVPSKATSVVPSMLPSVTPSSFPSEFSSEFPSVEPSSLASVEPSSPPSSLPSVEPSSNAPSSEPSVKPSALLSSVPSLDPSSTPSALPSKMPSTVPSIAPSESPSPGYPSPEIVEWEVLIDCHHIQELPSPGTTNKVCTQQMAICTVFLSFIGENLLAILHSLDLDQYSVLFASHTGVITMILPCALALAFIPNLRSLATAPTVGTLLLIASFAAIDVIMVQKWGDRPAFDNPPELKVPGVPLAICAVLYSYEAINLILPVKSVMQKAKEFERFFLWAVISVALILIAFSVICVVTVRDNTMDSFELRLTSM
jgi:hypothetical protein